MDKTQIEKLRDHCAALLDIWDDGKRPYEERAYIPDAFPQQIEELRAMLADQAHAPQAVPDDLPVAYIAQLSKTSHKSLTWSNHGGFIGTEYIPLYLRAARDNEGGDRMAQDAARYQWLRKRDTTIEEIGFTAYAPELGHDGSNLDSRIDEAIAASTSPASCQDGEGESRER